MGKLERYKYQDDIVRGCKICDIPFPIFEFRFDLERKYAADFAWPSRSLLVEIEGGTWTNHSRHTRGSGYLKDLSKYNLMATKRYYLMRFIPQDIKNGSAFREIKKFFDGETKECH